MGEVARLAGLTRAEVDRLERTPLAALLGHLVASCSVSGYMPEETFTVVAPDFLRLVELDEQPVALAA